MTTLAANRANDDDAPVTTAAAGVAAGVGVGSGIGGDVGFGDADGWAGGGALEASAVAEGLGDAGDSVVAASGAAAPASAACDDDGGVDGAGIGDGLGLGRGCADGLVDGRGDALGVVDGDADGLGSPLGDGAGERSGAGIATDGIVAAIVGAGDGIASASPCRPTNETPAPITNPSTMTPIKIGTSGTDGPDGGGGRRRVRRGGGVSCITPGLGNGAREALTFSNQASRAEVRKGGA